MLITTRENNSESRKCILFKCVLVAFIVFFSCFLLFNGCGVAHAADSMSDSDFEALLEYSNASNLLDNGQLIRLREYCDYMPYFAICHFGSGNDTIILLTNNPLYSIPIFWSYGNYNFNSLIDSNNLYVNPYVTENTQVYGYGGTSYIAYVDGSGTNDNLVRCCKIQFDGRDYYDSVVTFGSYNRTSNNVVIYNSSSLLSHGSNFDIDVLNSNTQLYSNCDDFKIFSFNYISSGTLVNNVGPTYTDDNRLKITTINDSYGNKDLVLDLTEFGTSTNAATYTYSDLTLSYIIDDVSYTLTDIDSYIEQIGDVQGLIDIMAFIPYSSFQPFTEYNNVILTGVSFTRTISSAGGSGSETFNILTEYYINKSSSQSGMDNINYSSDVSGDKATQEQIDTIYYNINFVEGEQISFEEMYEGDNTFPSNWSAHYVYLKNVTAAWNDLFQDDAITPFELFSTITEVCPDVDSAINHISTYLYSTNISNTFDVIIFDYIQETSSTYTHTFWYYTTVCGRIRAMSSIAADLYVDTNQIAVNTKETYNYLKLRLDDFEDKSLNKLDNIISNGNSTLSWLHTIDFDLSSGFNSVVNAINNIDVPEQDNTDIINKLSDVISAINNIGSPVSTNEIDTPQECIEYYRDNINTDIEDIPLQYRVAYFEGMTLDKLYTYGINTNNDIRLASTSDSEYTDQSIFIIKYFYDTILDVMNNSTMYNNLVDGINDLGDSSTYFYDMFDSDFDITVYHGFR